MEHRSKQLASDRGKHLRNDLHALAADMCVQDKRIRRAIEILQQDPKVSLDSIALRVNLSASRFRHVFKEEMGLSATLYRRMNQLSQARILLEGSFLRVKEVAAHVGVNDLSHFVRDYKALYGQTPSQTRALFLESGEPSLRSRFGQ